MNLILASSSPRRKLLLTQLLKSLGVKHPRFKIIHANIDESRRKSERPIAYARRLAKEKALYVAHMISGTSHQQRVTGHFFILSADTIVVLGNQIFGKPRNKKHAAWMLSRLSGRRHKVITAFCVIFPSQTNNHQPPTINHDTSSVFFHHLNANQIKSYINTKEPHDKAGAYAAQGQVGARHAVPKTRRAQHAVPLLVKKIEGSYTNVVGFPFEKIRPILKKWLRFGSRSLLRLSKSTHARKQSPF